jgi:hypothetical protein
MRRGGAARPSTGRFAAHRYPTSLSSSPRISDIRTIRINISRTRKRPRAAYMASGTMITLRRRAVTEAAPRRSESGVVRPRMSHGYRRADRDGGRPAAAGLQQPQERPDPSARHRTGRHRFGLRPRGSSCGAHRYQPATVSPGLRNARPLDDRVIRRGRRTVAPMRGNRNSISQAGVGSHRACPAPIYSSRKSRSVDSNSIDPPSRGRLHARSARNLSPLK